MEKKVFTAFACFYVVLSSLYAQNLSDRYTGVAAGAGVLIFNGNIGNFNSVGTNDMLKLGGNLSLEQRLGKFFSINANGLYGQLGGSNPTATSDANFQTTVYQGDLGVVFHTDRLFKKAAMTPFLGAGIGMLHYDSYADLKDANGETYYYWQDGSIRNQPQNGPINYATLQTLHRDYVYETRIDSLNKFNHHPIYFPLTFGIEFKIGAAAKASLAATYYYTLSNSIDGTGYGNNQGYLYTNFSICLQFGKKSEQAKDTQFDNVDFSKIDNADTDGDGVFDINDECPGTPNGVKVDAKGCPIDSDGDGIPDYLDKEPHSASGALVDNQGVTLTAEVLAKKKKDWEEALTHVTIEQKEKTLNVSGAGKTIPDDLKGADLNGDGLIQADEITKIIDGFFSGENDFTVDKINRLIDYFFEQ